MVRLLRNKKGRAKLLLSRVRYQWQFKPARRRMFPFRENKFFSHSGLAALIWNSSELPFRLGRSLALPEIGNVTILLAVERKSS
jgi:hypothetical protein